MVGLGQISLDCVAALPHWPRAGDKLELAAPAVARPGGQIATAVLAAVRLGLSGRLLGAVGEDANADIALAPLCAAGVDVSLVERVAGAATRSALVLVDADGERRVLGYRDPRLALRTADLSRDAIREARALLVDAEDPDAARWAIDAARTAGVATVLDVERPDPDPVELAMSVDFPIVSESFCSDSSESHRVSDAAERAWLTRLAGARARMAVVTRGARGALACCGGEILEQPAFAVDAVDTTGAGDSFDAGFLAAMLAGEPLERCLALANVCGALSTRAVGGVDAQPTLQEALDALERGSAA